MKEFIDRLKEKNIRVNLIGEDLEIKFTGQSLPQELLTDLKENKPQLISYLKAVKDHASFSDTDIPVAPLQDSYPLSSSQSRIWLLSQFDGANEAYNTYALYSITGDVDVSSFSSAFRHLVKRHEILRTVFKKDEGGNVRQYITDGKDFELELRDLTGMNADDAAVRRSELISEIVPSRFDLEKGPLLRARLIRTNENNYLFIYNMHHIISDGWSLEVMMTDILRSYKDISTGKQENSTPLTIQYKDFACWEENLFQSEKLKLAEKYWLDKFAGELPLTELPADAPRPQLKTYNGGIVSKDLGSEQAKQLRKLAHQNGGTLFMSVLSLLNLFLHKLSGSRDIIIGSPYVGRNSPDLENQIGCYINTIAYRTNINAEEGFVSLLNEVKDNVLESAGYAYYPFDRLVDKSSMRHDVSRSALFDVMINYESKSSGFLNNDETGNIGNLRVERLQEDSRVSKFDLTFHFSEQEDTLCLSIEYNTDIFSAASAERFLALIQNLAAAVIADPGKPISRLDYIGTDEKNRLLSGLNSIASGYPKDKTIVDLFEAQVKDHPGAIALVAGDEKYTYRELNESANRLAAYLRRQYAVQPDDLVGIRLERTGMMIVSILAILKSGAAYVPIDPAYPQQRIDYIVQNSECKAVIDENELHLFNACSAEFSPENVPVIARPENLAYVIYTSGTTGNPKGTLIEHRNVVRLLVNDDALFDFNAGDTWTMFHSYSFDFSVWEMYGALLFGGKLVLVPTLSAQDPELFLELLVKEKVTVLNQTPSSFYNLLALVSENNIPALALRMVIFGGEALMPKKLGPWKKLFPGTKLINMYGITETTVHVTYKEIGEKEINSGISNIGCPIPTLACYILDEHLQLLPAGVPGELYIAGEGVARGYLKNEELTNKRFLNNPFMKGGRLYRSGDKARLLDNGDLEYFGRMDDQVKIRGYRIELGEIENALLGHSEIESVVVIAKQTGHAAEKSLVAYIVCKKEISIKELRTYLRECLPAYMIPEYFVELEKLPLTGNGKVDKKMLPPPQDGGLKTGVEYVAPSGDIETQLVNIWAEILSVEKEKIGVADNFFDLGGNSIKAVRVANKVYMQLGLKLDLKELFYKQDIRSLAAELEDLRLLTSVKKRNSKQLI